MAIKDQLATVGKVVKKIPVTLSYKIIELFSAGLYSSPNKAIEELVANSYDAMATNINVLIPDDREHPNAAMWVIDDGDSMDDDELMQLWAIAESNKREKGRESAARPPIGKFGIGKLATFVLAKQLTYICKSKGKYRIVTMDYDKVDSTRAETTLKLNLRELTEVEAKDVLSVVLLGKGPGFNAIPLFGPNAKKTWTVVGMTDFKPLVKKLSDGRLKWILSTALPLSPKFKLFYNGQKIESSRLNIPLLESWAVGDEEDGEFSESVKVSKRPKGVIIKLLGLVTGSVELYQDPLTSGKSEGWGRSHGIFVMVRGRLINLDDALFGLPQLSHGPFSRFRMVIHADGLDQYLRSTREAVIEVEAVEELRDYIQNKFNKVRTYYNNWLTRKDYEAKISTRVNTTSLSLSRRPLLIAVKGLLDGTIEELNLIKIPVLNKVQKEEFLKIFEKDFSTGDIIKDVRLDALGVEYGMAIYDAETRSVIVNSLHPFFANYSEHYQNPEPFELIAVAEILTEAYLVEEELAPEKIRAIISRRDRFLRELVFSKRLAAPLVAQLLGDTKSDSKGLEKALEAGLQSLGFEVSPIGGSGEPDGTALARLGVRDASTGVREDYLITYDAKSTGNEKIKADKINAGTLIKHKKKYRANFSLVVAPGFEGEDDPQSSVNTYANNHDITLVTVDDFIKLVLAASTRQLGFSKLRDFFTSCRGPLDSRNWINAVLAEEVSVGPLPEILEAIWNMTMSSPDPIKFAAVRNELANKDRKYASLREADIRGWLESIRRFAGGYISIDGDIVGLDIPPQKILAEVRRLSSTLPNIYINKSLYAGLKNGK